jgi:carboxylesterase type B
VPAPAAGHRPGRHPVRGSPQLRQPGAARAPGPGADRRPVPPGPGAGGHHPRRGHLLHDPAGPDPIPADQYRPTLEATYGEDAGRVEGRYPLSAYRSARHALATIVSDREWAWPAEETDDLFARHVPTYAYEFTDRRATPLFDFPADLPPGASHGAELGYLFDRLGRPNDLDRAQRALANRMIRYWGRFARSGKHQLRFWKKLG